MPMLWENSFREGIDAFRSLNFQKALSHFDAAIAHNGEHYKVYDSRAAVNEKIGKTKNALRDSRKVIELAPQMRHGYTRSARLFLSIGKHDSALEMVRLALDRLKANDIEHRIELEALQRAILDAKDIRVAEEARKRPHIVKLPVELISEIFILSAEMDDGSPISVSLVCSHWREIALSTTALWKRVVLSDVRPVWKMKLWQERSKGQITSLRICAGTSRLQLQDAFTECSPDFFKKLKYFHSEVDLLLLSTCLMIAPNFFELDLEDIRVSVSSKGQTYQMESPLASLVPLTRPSSARSLIVEYVNVDWTDVVPQLAHLRILVIRTLLTFPSTALLCTLLETNPQLEEVILETGAPWELDVAAISQRSELPFLSQLQLLGPMDAGCIISRLSMPNIKRLVISQCLRAVDEAISALDPPFPALTELSIRKCSFSENRLASFIQRMLTLTKLEITHSGGPMDIVVDVIAGSKDGTLGETTLICPELQHVNFSHSPNLNGGPIVRLVRSRLRATEATGSSTASSAKINVIIIDGCPRVDPSVPEWLRSRVEVVSCVYMTKDDIKKLSRRRGIYQ